MYASALVERVSEQFTTLVFNNVSYEMDCDPSIIFGSPPQTKTSTETACNESWFIENSVK